MIKNKTKYTELKNKEKAERLQKLSQKQGVKLLEEIIGFHDHFSQKTKDPLPLSLDKLLNANQSR